MERGQIHLFEARSNTPNDTRGAGARKVALSRAERINGLLTRWREGLGGSGTQTARELVNLLGGNPFVTARGAEKKLGVAFNTVVRAIGQLETAGIVKEVSAAKRHRVWCCQALLDILEEPARLTPENPLG